MLLEYRLEPHPDCNQEKPCRVLSHPEVSVTWIVYCSEHERMPQTAPVNPLTHDIRRGSVTGKRRRNTA